MAFPQAHAYFSVTRRREFCGTQGCIGKRLTPPPPVEQCGVWPFEPAQSYETFIIGTDDVGNTIEFTCDSDALANYFGANPQAPHFLTPVFFKRAVLEKY